MTRWLLIAGGFVFVGLATLGAILPVMPTTVFLIGAVACFARSSPRLERKLVEHRLFAPYMPYIYGDQPLPRRARIAAMVGMWTCVLISFVLLLWRDGTHPVLPPLLLGLGVIATVAIATWRRAPRS